MSVEAAPRSASAFTKTLSTLEGIFYPIAMILGYVLFFVGGPALGILAWCITSTQADQVGGGWDAIAVALGMLTLMGAVFGCGIFLSDSGDGDPFVWATMNLVIAAIMWLILGCALLPHPRSIPVDQGTVRVSLADGRIYSGKQRAPRGYFKARSASIPLEKSYTTSVTSKRTIEEGGFAVDVGFTTVVDYAIRIKNDGTLQGQLAKMLAKEPQDLSTMVWEGTDPYAAAVSGSIQKLGANELKEGMQVGPALAPWFERPVITSIKKDYSVAKSE